MKRTQIILNGAGKTKVSDYKEVCKSKLNNIIIANLNIFSFSLHQCICCILISVSCRVTFLILRTEI